MIVFILLLADLSVWRTHLLHHNVLSVSISLWSSVTSTKPGIRVLSSLSTAIFGVLILEILIWILIVYFFCHLVRRWLLKLLGVYLLWVRPTLLSHSLWILLEHLVVALYLLLVRNYVLLGSSRTGITIAYMSLILVIFMWIHILTLWHLSIKRKY